MWERDEKRWELYISLDCNVWLFTLHTESVLMIMRSLKASAWNWLEIKRLFYLNIWCWLFVRSRMWLSNSLADCLLGEVGPACINIRWFKSHNYLLKSFAKSITFLQLSLREREILCGHVGKYYQPELFINRRNWNISAIFSFSLTSVRWEGL